MLLLLAVAVAVVVVVAVAVAVAVAVSAVSSRLVMGRCWLAGTKTIAAETAQTRCLASKVAHKN